MAIGNNAASMGDIRTEWGRSGAIKMSEMYRGGTHVKSKASDNTATNDAAGVPTSGAISIDDFRGTSASFTFTFSSGATNQSASSIFGDDYDLNYAKNIVINSGVELGATSTSEEALEIETGAAGTITITNNGTLSGAGGAAGAAGGDAFEAASTCTFINNGTVRAGGGGGGSGGSGGGGSFTTSSSIGGTNYSNDGNCHARCSSVYGHSPSTPSCGSGCNHCCGGLWQCTNCVRSSTTNTNGGSGGGGAVGAGYNQSAGTGSGGSAGGTNAGTGGTGGNGGSFGNAGSTGASGANGNRTNGSSGSAGGAAGKYLRGSSFVTFTNNGTVQGGTA